MQAELIYVFCKCMVWVGCVGWLVGGYVGLWLWRLVCCCCLGRFLEVAVCLCLNRLLQRLDQIAYILSVKIHHTKRYMSRRTTFTTHTHTHTHLRREGIVVRNAGVLEVVDVGH